MPKAIRRYYPNLALGYDPSAPPRSLDPDAGSGYIWRDSLNMIEREGVLIRRAATQASGLSIPYQFLSGAADDTETVLAVYRLQNSQSSSGLSPCTIVITNRLIYVQPAGAAAWVITVPTYTTGTVTATNGSVNISGAGTLWSSLFITAGALITIDGVNYQIASVTGDTTATLTANYAGATGGGKAYTIYRSFPGGGPVVTQTEINHVFATVFNNTLYVAGSFCGSSSSAVKQPAVIKVSNIFSSPTASYITAQSLLVAGLDNISNLTSISGITALQDGRIVLIGGQNTVFYSSHLNDAVWTVSPGGQTIVTYSPGKTNALGQIGNVYTIHHNDGVVLAYPTGFSDPPLRYQASHASVGVWNPRTLCRLGAVEYGVDSNGGIIRFDGNLATTIDDQIKAVLVSQTDYITAHAGIDSRRSEYMLFYPNNIETDCYVYQVKKERWWPLYFPAPIGSWSDAAFLGTTIRAIVGAWSLNNAAETNPTLVSQEDATADSYVHSQATVARFYVTTDDLDFGDPGNFKAAQRLLLWCQRLASGTVPILVSVSRDQGVSWTTLTSQNWPANLDQEAALQFSFDALTPGAGHSLRFRIEINTVTFRLELRRMIVEALESGTVEQVQL